MATHNKNLCIKRGVHPLIVWAVRKSIVFFCYRGGKQTRRKLINLRVLAIPSYKNEAMVACKVRVLADDVSIIKVVVENE